MTGHIIGAVDRVPVTAKSDARPQSDFSGALSVTSIQTGLVAIITVLACFDLSITTERRIAPVHAADEPATLWTDANIDILPKHQAIHRGDDVAIGPQAKPNEEILAWIGIICSPDELSIP